MTLRRFSNAIQAASALRKSTSAAIAFACLTPAASAPAWCVAISSVLTRRLRVHLPSRAHVRREQRQVLEHHPLLPLVHPKRQQRRHLDLRLFCGTRRRLCSASSGIGITTDIGGGGEGNALRGRVGREFFGPLKHTLEVARGPLGVRDVLVAACDSAEEAGFYRRSSRFVRSFV
jgi:hypothetical protein